MKFSSEGKFQFFDHAADVGIEVTSPSLSGLFTTAARALLAWMGPEPAGHEVLETSVELAAEDLEELMVRWLQEVLYLFYHQHAYATDAVGCDIVDNNRLSATVRYKPWEESRYQDYQEVKAATYHQLQVLHQPEGWSARIILDL
jgi:SHS2 domain-containing protein